MPDTLNKVRQDIDRRLKELGPVVKEYQRLEAALDRLSRVSKGSGNFARRGRGDRSGTARRKSQGASQRRIRVSREDAGKRREQIIAILRESPSTRPAALAAMFGISPQNVHQDLRNLRETNRLRKTDSGYQAI
jgi:hypothetical protein